MPNQQPREMATVVDNSQPYQKPPELKQYLICIHGNDYDEWVIVTGRKDAYEYIRDNIDNIILDDSFILVESCKLSERKSIYVFMKKMQQFFQEGFDIDDYVKGDWSEQDFQLRNDIAPELNISSSQRINPADLAGGSVELVDLD